MPMQNTCKLPEIPKFETPNSPEPPKGSQDPATPKRSQNPVTPSSPGASAGADAQSNTGGSQQKKVDPNATPKTSGSGDKPGGSFFFSRCSEREALFSNPKPAPTAVILAEIILTPDQDLILYDHGSPVPVPLDNRRALTRSSQSDSRLSSLQPSCKGF